MVGCRRPDDQCKPLHLLGRLFFVVLAVPAFVFANTCPDLTMDKDEGKELSEDEFRSYIEDPDVINFGISDAFVCYRLKLYSRVWGRDGSCSHHSSASMSPGDFGAGHEFRKTSSYKPSQAL